MLAVAHGRLSWIQASYDWDWEAARASAQRALDLEPGNADALRAASNIAGVLGHFDEAINLSRKAIERDPLRASLYGALGYFLMASHREEEAEASYRKAVEVAPGGAGRHMNVGTTLVLQDRAKEALPEMQLETDGVWKSTAWRLSTPLWAEHRMPMRRWRKWSASTQARWRSRLRSCMRIAARRTWLSNGSIVPTHSVTPA